MRKRAVWVEPLFGEAKDWHGLRRFRLRCLEKVNTEALLKAAGQNVKRLLAFGTRGPRDRHRWSPCASQLQLTRVPLRSKASRETLSAPSETFSTRCRLPGSRVNKPPVNT